MIHILYGLNFVYGLILNSLIVLVCFRKRLRQMATFIILAFLALSNTLALFGYPLHSFVNNILSVNLKRSNAVWCKLVVTTTAFTFEWTIWLLALAAIEMYLTLRIENLRLRYSNCRNTIIVCILLGLISIAFNFPTRVLNAFDLIVPKNRTILNVCSDTRLDDDLILFYTKAHRFSLVVFPVILVIIFNILLIYELKASKKASLHTAQSIIKDDLKNMAKTLIIISLVFVVILIPRSIVTLVYSACCSNSEWLFALIECIDFIYSICLNSIFFILITRNELFTDEFKNFYLRQHSSDLSHI